MTSDRPDVPLDGSCCCACGLVFDDEHPVSGAVVTRAGVLNCCANPVCFVRALERDDTCSLRDLERAVAHRLN